MPFRSRAPHDEAHPLGHDGTNIMDHAAALTAQTLTILWCDRKPAHEIPECLMTPGAVSIASREAEAEAQIIRARALPHGPQCVWGCLFVGET